MSKRGAQFTFLASILLPFATAELGSFFTVIYRFMVDEARATAEKQFLASRKAVLRDAEQALLEAAGGDQQKIVPVVELIAQSEELLIEQAKAAGEKAAAAKKSELAWTPVAYFYYFGNAIFYGGIFCGFCGALGAMGHLFGLEREAREFAGN